MKTPKTGPWEPSEGMRKSWIRCSPYPPGTSWPVDGDRVESTPRYFNRNPQRETHSSCVNPAAQQRQESAPGAAGKASWRSGT